MEITQKHVNEPELLTQNFNELAIGLASDVNGEAFQQFHRVVLNRFPLADWKLRPIADLFNALLDFYHFIDARAADKTGVEVYNPSLDERGWLSGRTVVVVNCSDAPFLVDSIRMVIEQHEYAIHVSKSTVFRCVRGEGRLETIQHNSADAGEKEVFAYFEITSILSEKERKSLVAAIQASIHHVKRVVGDYPKMITKLVETKTSLASDESAAESEVFLNWLKTSNFTFLGYRELDFDTPIDRNADLSGRRLVENVDARLGVFTVVNCAPVSMSTEEFTEGSRVFYEGRDFVFFSKSNTRSTVHRNVYPDYIVVKKLNSDGEVCGECRFLGFYTYAVSSLSPTQIPLLREKVAYVITKSGLDVKTHDGKRLMRYIELHPKEELFQSTAEELHTNFNKIVDLNERDIVRLIARVDPFKQFVSCMVYVPKDLYTTGLRIKIQKLIGSAIGALDADVTTFFSESKHARAHIVFTLPTTADITLNVDELEAGVIELAHGWKEHFRRALDERFGESLGGHYYKSFNEGIPNAYQDNFDARFAVQDIEVFETLNAGSTIYMQLYQPLRATEGEIRFRVSHMDEMLELSDVIPILENLGFRVLGEQPFKISSKDGRVFWLHDFQLKIGRQSNTDVGSIKSNFEAAFAKAWSKETQSDSFNQLVPIAGLNWREINLLRAYANYMKQTLFHLSLEYIADTLISYPVITKRLIEMFTFKFDPSLSKTHKKRIEKVLIVLADVEAELENVSVLNQDKVFRRYIDLFKGTLRTNYYQRTDSGESPSYLSLKFNPAAISDIPDPKPAFEFFVFSARVEGVHLRTSKVARGGLRWSDREEDYRTEVLGLVKAQQVKNAVIVPSGAKGGFVAKQLPQSSSRAQFLAEGIECYKIFIRGMLDLTDNLMEGQVIKPSNVVCHDDDDPYLVVAADKGTATFSDIANEISIEKQHWLGDAFASGGSQGYDHKGMGITAKGAWVSVQRHFRERGLNTQSDPFTVVGVGDMAGDVFGNGMLLSESIKLVAAFNHMHIFIDPDPVPADSFHERLRLFNTPGTSWSDYDETLISKGGGVFNRSNKYIPLSSQMMALLDTSEQRLPPNDLITLLLKSKVDLIWNGGIGTYVKASSESHADVGDKANDCLRINGDELQCLVFGEGGNLGMTQKGRIEFAHNSGSCNTDFIDNAAGVDCSDHEVNIKILIDAQVALGELTQKQRNALLVKMTDEVSSLVLHNNDRQTLALSIASLQVESRMREYRRFIEYLEEIGRLNRELEHLPSDTMLVERIGRGQSLTSPELSVLISYAKVQLKEELSLSEIGDDVYCAQSLFTEFPAVLHKPYKASIEKHKLRKEIIATQLANDFINNLGITAYHRLTETTGSTGEEVVKAYVASRDIFGLEGFVQYISSLNYQIDAQQQYRLLSDMIRRVRRGTRWFLKNRRSGLKVKTEVQKFSATLKAVQKATGDLLPEQEKLLWQARVQELEDRGINEAWLNVMAMPDNLFSGLGVVEVSNACSASIEECTHMFLSLMHELKLNWFATQLSGMKVENYWQANARESYIDDLESQLRKLATLLLNNKQGKGVEEKIKLWIEHNALMVGRWTTMVNKVESTARTDYAMFAVALRELNDLVQVTAHT